MNWLQNGNLAKLVAFFVIAVVITCTVSFAANGWQSFINADTSVDTTPDDGYIIGTMSGEIGNNDKDNTDTLPPAIKFYHSITGLEVNAEEAMKRPICICIDSSDPLYGLSSSYLTIEFPTEYGNTRFLCFTDEAKSLGKIGSLAPSRGYVSNLAAYFGGILLSYGTDDKFDYSYSEPSFRLDFVATGGYCYTEYTSFVYTNGDLVGAFLNNTQVNQTLSDSIPLPYYFPDEVIKINLYGGSAQSVFIPFSDSSTSQLNYITSENTYVLTKNSASKNDLINDKPLKYDNVFVLYADSTTYETERDTQLILNTDTKGSGIYASGGRYIDITWERDTAGNLVFFNSEGERLTVSRGTSYIAFAKASSKSLVKIS